MKNTKRLTSTRRLATFARSWQLLRSFPLEQTTPAVFYGNLAEDTAELLAALATDFKASLEGARVLDVGGGPGYFAQAFARRKAQYFSVDPAAGEMAGLATQSSGTVRGDGTALPFTDATFDITYSSNVVEHVAQPWKMADEILRVTAPGGLAVISYTVWLGPFGGHETGLWQHYLGGDFARRRYMRTHGHPPKNVFGSSLFAVSAKQGLNWAAQHKAHVFPRYHPSWAWWVVKVPILREFLTSNLVIVVKKEA